MRRALLAAAIALAQGCFAPPALQSLACSTSLECPSGSSCGCDHRCQRGPEGCGVDGGADSEVDGASGPRCGTMSLLTDDFEDGVRSPLWGTYSPGGVTLAETGGELVITLPSNSPNYEVGLYGSAVTYDLTESRMYVEVPAMVNTASAAGVQLLAGRFGWPDQYQLEQKQGKLFFRYSNGGDSGESSVDYDPVAHKWWQLRESAGRVLWETSRDGVTWDRQWDRSAAPFIGFNYVQLAAYEVAGTSNPGAVHFDHLNGGDPPTGSFCPSSSLQDDFDDGVPALAWNVYGAQESSGELVIPLANNATVRASYKSKTAYDFTNGAASVEVTQTSDATTPAFTELELNAIDGQGDLAFYEQSGVLHFLSQRGSTVVETTIPYDSRLHRWWRIRESGGTTYWETSDGRSPWVTHRSEPDPIPVRALTVTLDAGTNQAVPNPGTAHFDNFNIYPVVYCGASRIQDDFDDNVTSPIWDVSQIGGASIVEAGGQVVGNPASSMAGPIGAAYLSHNLYDLRDDRVFIEVPAVQDQASRAESYLQVITDSNRYVDINQSQGMINARKENGTGLRVLHSVPFSATSHRWWQIRESAGTTYWETKADGAATWDVLYSEPSEPFLDAVRVAFGVFTWYSEANPGDARFDNLNGGGPPSACR